MRHKLVGFVWLLVVCRAITGRAQVTTGTSSRTVADATTAGRIDRTIGDGRQMQFSLKLLF